MNHWELIPTTKSGDSDPGYLLSSRSTSSAYAKGRGGCSVYLENGTINGVKKVTYVMKIWNISDNWLNFYTELYLYTHPRLLRPLQGICVPSLIGVVDSPGGHLGFAMKTPHSVGWRTASPTISAEEKDAIVEAYKKIHAQGVEHGSINYRHMLIGDDSKVTIIDFSKSKCVVGSDPENPTLGETTPESLERELRKVKFLLDYGNAKETEYTRARRNNVTQYQLRRACTDELSHGDKSFPFTLFELERWELEGRRGIHFEIRTRKKSSAALQTHLLPWSDVLEFKTSLRAEKATETTHGIPPCLAAEDAPLSRPRSPDRPAISSPVPSPVSAGTKRSRESLEEITPNAKRVKVLQFHPDTNDNGLWATGRPFMRRCHQPTPCSIRGGDDGTDTAEEERQHQWPTADFAMVVASNLPGATAFPQGAP